MSFKNSQYADFIDEVVPTRAYLLDDVCEWIRENLSPEDVFSDKQLESWAFESGFQKFD